MLTYTHLTKIQKIELVQQLRIERVRLLTESRRIRAKKSNKTNKRRIPKNLQFKSPELKAIFDNSDMLKELLK